jgi:CRP-like cAMP-binding protein
MGLIIDEPRIASARFTQTASIVIIPRGAFEKRLERINPFVRGLIKLMIYHIQKIWIYSSPDTEIEAIPQTVCSR